VEDGINVNIKQRSSMLLTSLKKKGRFQRCVSDPAAGAVDTSTVCLPKRANTIKT
jgi:hypothetical protein